MNGDRENRDLFDRGIVIMVKFNSGSCVIYANLSSPRENVFSGMILIYKLARSRTALNLSTPKVCKADCSCLPSELRLETHGFGCGMCDYGLLHNLQVIRSTGSHFPCLESS